MKETIFNASLEESMNLVTDKYIKASLEDFNEKGYGKKIFGFFTVQFFLFLFFLFSFFIDSQKLKIFFMNTSLINGFIFLIGFFVLALYLNDVRKIKDQSILSYYYYNKNIFFMTSLLYMQFLVICIAGAGMIIGGILSSILYAVFFILFIVGLFHSFKKKTLEVLHAQSEYSNPAADFITRFIAFVQKYGGVLVLLLILFRVFFPNSDVIQQNGIIRSIVIAISPLLFLPFIYFGYALATDNFQGYYLKKYLEDYRQISGYSIKEWYGKKSKICRNRAELNHFKN